MQNLKCTNRHVSSTCERRYTLFGIQSLIKPRTDPSKLRWTFSALRHCLYAVLSPSVGRVRRFHAYGVRDVDMSKALGILVAASPCCVFQKFVPEASPTVCRPDLWLVPGFFSAVRHKLRDRVVHHLVRPGFNVSITNLQAIPWIVLSVIL